MAPLVGSLEPQGEVDEAMKQLIEQFMGPDTLLGRALSLNGAFSDVWNERAVHAAEIGAANGITNARSLSRFYAGLVGSVAGGPARPLLTAKQMEAARQRQTEGPDKLLMFESAFGLGFFIASDFAPYGGAGSFGHSGAGGSMGFADPDNQIAGGYVMNRMAQNLSGDPRTRGLVKASYEAVGAPIAFV